MRILSWNVNGVKACVRHGDFEQIRKLEAVDVICLQEIRTQDRPIVLKGYHHYWYPAEQKRYSGTMTLSLVKPERVIYGIGAPELDTEGRVLTIELGSLFVVNVYVPNSTGSPERREYRRRWDEAFLCFLKELSEEKDVIVCGDFNVTMSRKDIYAENERMDYAELGYVSDERSHLMSLMKEGFVDAFRYLYPEEAKAYTWWSNRLYKRNEGRGWRLDYFLVCESLKDKIQYVVHHQEIRGSDHCPIVLGCEAGDEFYGEKAMEALEERVSREDEEKRLAAGWKRREAFFPRYRESLKEIQAEITIAARMRDNEKVRKLQISLLENIRFKFLAVEKVSNMHAPPGSDNVKWRTDAEKMRAVGELDWKTFEASPKRLIEIKTKMTGKVRRAGILTYRDKAMALLCKWGFSPVEEAVADRMSFAFRPGRSKQEAVHAMAGLFYGNRAPEGFVYIDVKSCYASVQHRWLLANVPMPKSLLRSFLKAGHVFEGELFPGEETGISEGSPLSPDIANYTLDGMQRAIYMGLYGKTRDIDYANGAMVRYADDVVVAVRTLDDAKVVIDSVKKFLEPRGLEISYTKSFVGDINKGFEVIGYKVSKGPVDMLIRPREESVKRFKCEMHDYIVNFTGSQRELIAGLNKRLNGWAGHYRCCDAYDSYSAIDSAVEESLLESAIEKHPKLQRAKVLEKYWYTDNDGVRWYALPDEREVRVMHLTNTLLVVNRRAYTNDNPYLTPDIYEARKAVDDIDRVNARYRPVFDKFDGKCMYCGRPLLIDQPKKLVLIDPGERDALWNKAYVHEVCVQSDYQFLMTVENVDGITDYDVCEMLKRILKGGNVIRDCSLGEDYRYMKLYEWFGMQTKPKIVMKFKEIEEILGFELPEGFKRNRTQWYRKQEGYRSLADAWTLQLYKIGHIDMGLQKVWFEAQFEDAEMVVIPRFIAEHKVPLKAKYEIEHFLQWIMKKYCLGDGEGRKRKGKI